MSHIPETLTREIIMMQKFLKTNKGWIAFLATMLLFMGVVYKVQADEPPVKVSPAIDMQTLEVVDDDTTSDKVGFIERVGATYRTVVTKTSTGYATFKEAFDDKIYERQVQRYVESVDKHKLIVGAHYPFTRYDGVENIPLMFVQAGDFKRLTFQDSSGNIYKFDLDGQSLSSNFISIDFAGPTLNDGELSEPLLGKDIPILSNRSANN